MSINKLNLLQLHQVFTIIGELLEKRPINDYITDRLLIQKNWQVDFPIYLNTNDFKTLGKSNEKYVEKKSILINRIH